MRMIKKIKYFVVLSILALSLTACGGSAPIDSKKALDTKITPTIALEQSTQTPTPASSVNTQTTPSAVKVESVLDDKSGINEQLAPPKKGEKIAIMTTSLGSMKIKFFPKEAPKAVENFVTHSGNGYYNGIKFHRILNNFMIQSGDPKGDGTGGESIWRKPFEDEFSPLRHNFRGALSMANSGPKTNGSQFFIVQKKTMTTDDSQFLNGGGVSEAVAKKYMEIGGTAWLDNRHTVFGQVFEGMDVVDKIANVELANAAMGVPKEAVLIKKVEITTWNK